VTNMLTNKPETRILVDGGDPKETLRIRSLIGLLMARPQIPR
jgi:hypothetical protein